MDQFDDKKIALLATMRNHVDYYLTLVSLWAPYSSEILIIGSQQILADLKIHLPSDSKTAFLEWDVDHHIETLFHKHQKMLNLYTAIIIDEIYASPFPLWLSLMRYPMKSRLVYTIHNANLWLYPRFLFLFKHMFDALCRKCIIKKMDALLVMSPLIRNYIRDMNLFRREVFVVPFKMPSSSHDRQRQMNGRLKFVIPGLINLERKDYQRTIDVFEEIWASHPADIQLTLLGEPDKDPGIPSFLQRCDQINQRYGQQRIRYWPHRIDPQTFQQEIEDADVILLNMRVFYLGTATPEIYGITKESGATFHMMSTGKPMIAPEHYATVNGFKTQVLKFQDWPDLKDTIINIAQGIIDLDELKKAGEINGRRFQEWMQKETRDFFEGFLKI
jgi:hypothetical protein